MTLNQLFNSLCHANDLLFEGSLFRFQISELLVQSDALGSHRAVVPVDLLLHAVKLICEGLSGVLALHREDILESLLLAAQDLDFFLVSGEVLVQLAACLGQVRQLTLKVCRVLRALHLTHGCLT